MPIVVAALAAALVVVRESTDRQGRRFDAAGVAFGALTLAAIIFAIIEAGHGGRSATVAIAIVVGMGVLAPAVVAAAVGAVPGERAGLASAVNNTARQAGGAIGIAACGALAGRPGSPGFVGGLHTVAIVVAALFASAAIASLVGIPQQRG